MMQLPIVSAGLTIARAMRGLTVTEVASLAGVKAVDVFMAENMLDNADYQTVMRVASVLNVDVDKLLGRQF